jgi:hypothetical protein
VPCAVNGLPLAGGALGQLTGASREARPFPVREQALSPSERTGLGPWADDLRSAPAESSTPRRESGVDCGAIAGGKFWPNRRTATIPRRSEDPEEPRLVRSPEPCHHSIAAFSKGSSMGRTLQYRTQRFRRSSRLLATGSPAISC